MLWRLRRRVSDLHVAEQGQEALSYVLVLALVVLPVFGAVRLLWTVLLYYYMVEALIIDMPLF